MMCRRNEFGRRWNGETPFLQFRGNDGEQMGALWYRDGKFSFEGDADKSVGNLMKALNSWSENFVPRFDYAEAVAHIVTLTEFLNRMQLAANNGDKKRLEMQLEQARDVILRNHGRFNL
jgi:hypothetical protein